MDAEAQVDASALAVAATFGVVSFPTGMPDYLKEAILDRAELARNADGGFLIDGRIKSEIDRRRDAQNDDDDNLTQLAQMVRQEQQEREREEWAHTKSTVAGVTLTGAEWARLAERLRSDGELKEVIMAAFRKRGAAIASIRAKTVEIRPLSCLEEVERRIYIVENARFA